MTEQDWLAGTEPTTMVGFLGGLTSHRKLWLFGCACCRRIWHLLPPAGREAVAAGELYADGDIAHSGLMDASLKNYRDADATGDELTIHCSQTKPVMAGHLLPPSLPRSPCVITTS